MYVVNEYDNDDVSQWFFYSLNKAYDKRKELLEIKIKKSIHDSLDFEIETIEQLNEILKVDDKYYWVNINKIIFEDEQDI